MNSTAPLPTVLVLDDDQDILESIADLLTDEGYPTRAAQHWRQALEILIEMKDGNCIILCDMYMPGMNGAAFIDLLQNRSPPLQVKWKVFLLSASPECEASAEKLGTEFIKKPFDLSYLIERIKPNALSQATIQAQSEAKQRSTHG